MMAHACNLHTCSISTSGLSRLCLGSFGVFVAACPAAGFCRVMCSLGYQKTAEKADQPGAGYSCQPSIPTDMVTMNNNSYAAWLGGYGVMSGLRREAGNASWETRFPETFITGMVSLGRGPPLLKSCKHTSLNRSVPDHL
jgi:hypothetical protein